MLFLYLLHTKGADSLVDIFVRNLDIKDFLVIDNGDTSPSALGTWSHVAIEKALARLGRSQIDDLRFVWGPYPHAIDSYLPKPCARMTLLGDPVERALIHYRTWAKGTKEAARTLDDWLSVHHPHCPLPVDNYMTRILSGASALDPTERGATTESYPCAAAADFECAAGNLDRYSLVGLADHLDEMLVVLGADLCWSLSDLVYKPPAQAASAGEVKGLLRERIMEWNRYDAALIERARTHLARRICSYPGDFEKDLALFRKLNALFQQGIRVQELRRLEYEATVGQDHEHGRGRPV